MPQDTRPADGRSDPWRDASPEQLARRYYDATTWIYRWAWGSSFHFAPLRRGEARRHAIHRYEVEMARTLGLDATSQCIDLGCGIGGPGATIAAASGARVLGLNQNLGQLRAARKPGRRRGAAAVVPIGADFSALPLRSGRLDAAYAFEALCHAVDLDVALAEVHRVLRPGGRLGLSEWHLTASFDARDPQHRDLRSTIEASYGVARLRTLDEWQAALDGAGLRVVSMGDRAQEDGADGDPWYRALTPRDRSFDSLARAAASRRLQQWLLAAAERLRLAPPATAATVRQLRAGTAALIEAGERGIFSPLLFVVAERPGAAAFTV